MNYEINKDTLAILPGEKGSKVMEIDNDYEVDFTPYEVMEHSCTYFGSSFEGRILGSKDILGSIYKVPVVVEETQELIFFPTEAITSENVGWLAYKNIKNVEKFGKKSKVIFNNASSIIVDCPYFSIKNQIFRCNMLDNVTKTRKNSKKND